MADTAADKSNQAGQTQAAEVLRVVLPLLSKYKIPPNPLNYAIWYEYIARQHFNQQDEDLASAYKNGMISTDSASALFQRYVADYDVESLNELRAKLRDMSILLSKEMKDIVGESETHEEQLASYSEKLANASEAELADVVGELIQCTKSMAESGRKFKNAVSSANSEIKHLREEIESVRIESQTDVLTGLLNRRYLDQVLAKLYDAYQENPEPFSIMMIDIDKFKSFNDDFGHLWGDQVLKHVAHVVRDQLQGDDLVARFGGEEFCVVLFKSTITEAMKVAERTRDAVEVKKLKKKASGKPLRDVTISLGVAEYNGKETIAEMIERADKALYEAKEGGRNCARAAK